MVLAECIIMLIIIICTGVFFVLGRPSFEGCIHHLFPRRAAEEQGQENL